MRYLTVMDLLELKSIYLLRCMHSGKEFYVRAKYFAGTYKKFDVIRMSNNNSTNVNLNEGFYEQE